MNSKHLIYDARGNGGGTICPTITGDHQNRITDYTAIIIQKQELGEVQSEKGNRHWEWTASSDRDDRSDESAGLHA